MVTQGTLFRSATHPEGPDCARETAEAKNAVAALGGRIERTELYTIPGTEVSHAAVIIKKTGVTAGKYPRRWAQIKSRPL